MLTLESDAVKIGWLLYSFTLVALHTNYAHGSWTMPQSLVALQLVTDLMGFAGMRWVFTALAPHAMVWLDPFLAVHAAIHALSLLWALCHFKSLYSHMLEFQGRKLNFAFWLSEFLYEQSDTAAYIASMCLVAARLPLLTLVMLIVSCSGGVALVRATFFATPKIKSP